MAKNSIISAMWGDQLALVKKNKAIVTQGTVLEPFFQAGLTPILTEGGDVDCKESLSSIERQIILPYAKQNKGKIVAAIRAGIKPKTDVTGAARTREVLGDAWVAECFPTVENLPKVASSPLFTALVSKLKIKSIASPTNSGEKDLWQILHEECRSVETQREKEE